MAQDQEITAVVISGGGTPGAYDIVRALSLRGVKTTVASSERRDIAFYSRFCDRRVVLPEFEPHNYRLILNVLRWTVAGQHEKPVLFYASDPELSFVSRFREDLKHHFRFLLPPEESLHRLYSKVSFVSLAKEYQLPVPETRCVSNVKELRSVLRDIPLPCIVKPAFSEDWIWETEEQRLKFGPYKKALRRMTSRRDVLEFCRSLPARSEGFLVQSYIEGRDEEITSFHGYFDEASQCCGSFLGRKIRTYPPHTGGSVYVETIVNQELSKRSVEYLQRVKFQGIVKIDYKWDPGALEYKILEINPRYNLWELLGAYAGVNLAWIAYQSQRGRRVPVQPRYRSGLHLLYFKQDVRALIEGYRKSEEWTWLSYIRSLLNRNIYRVYDSSDPLPFVISSMAFLTRNTLRLLRVGLILEVVKRSLFARRPETQKPKNTQAMRIAEQEQ